MKSDDNKTFQLEAKINASINKCWNAWVETKEAKQWLGLSSIGSKPLGDFTVSTGIPYLSGRHRIVSIEKEKHLKFDWFVEGHPSSVEAMFSKGEKADTTKIQLMYKVDVSNAPENIEALHYSEHYFYFIGQSWGHAIRRLKSQLEGNSPINIPRNNNDHTINLEVEINSTPEKVFQALIDPEHMKKWGGEEFMFSAEVEPKVGGVYSYGWYPKGTPIKDIQDGPQKILELEKNKLLIHDWYGGTQLAKASWKIEKKPDGKVLLKFKHSNILGHPSEYVSSYRNGWADSLFAIKWYLEKGILDKDWLVTK